jgi:uncharacterized protein YecE (DUF72 family)
MTKILIGTSAWSDHDNFYPAGLKPPGQLPYYASIFPVVEINTTYYRLPSKSMVQGWVDRSPDGFVFDVKPPRELTGTPAEPGAEAPTPDADMATAFLDSIEPLRESGKLGALTFQFPPSWRNSEGNREYLRLLPELFPNTLIAVEFRRRDWLDDGHADDTLALLKEHNLVYTMADEPQAGTGTVPPVYGVTNPKMAILRFHGRNGKTWYHFGGSSRLRFDWVYTEEELSEWVPKLHMAASQVDIVHVFFNTNAGDQGPRNARLLLDLLGMSYPFPDTAVQPSLFPPS